MGRMGKTLVLLSALLSLSVCALAGNTSRQYDVGDGLSDNCVLDVIQDRDGYIWLATKDGLNKFNGYSFSAFGSSSSGSPIYIEKIYEHNDGRHIWVATPDRLFLFDKYSQTFQEFTRSSSNEGVRVPGVHSFCSTESGDLWIGSYSGVFRYDKDGTLQSWTGDILPGKDVRCVFCDSGGRIYAGCQGMLMEYDAARNTFKPYVVLGSDGKTEYTEVTAVAESGDGRIWIGTWDGRLFWYDRKRGEVVSCNPPKEKGFHIGRIHSINDYSKSQYAICTDTGLFFFDRIDGTWTSHSFSYSEESIYCCLRDREGGFWISSYFCGVHYVSPHQNDFSVYREDASPGTLRGNAVEEICEDSRGNLWIATENGGLNYLDRKTGRFIDYTAKSHSNLHALCLDGDELWIGTFSKGLDRMNVKSGRVRSWRHDPKDSLSLLNDHVYSIRKSPDGNVYVGTLSGLVRYEPASDRFYPEHILDGEFVIDLAVDAEGNLWAVSKGTGIYRKDCVTGEWKNWNNDKPGNLNIPAGRMNRVYVADDGELWFCTDGFGLYRYVPATDSFDVIYSDDNLPLSIYYTVLRDDDGLLWISSNKGLIKYDRDSRETTIYTVDDGLQSNQFNFRSSLKTSDGLLWFGGINGLSSFNPSEMKAGTCEPTVMISSVSFPFTENDGGPSVQILTPQDKAIRIPHYRTSFEINYECLSFVSPSNNRYAWKMDGLKDEWTYTNETKVSLIKLPVGHYTFHVIGADGTGKWCAEEATLDVIVRPAPWLSAWAKVLYVLSALLLAAFVIWRVRRRQRENRLREQENLATLRENELMKERMEFFSNMAHEIKTPLSLICAPLEQVIAAGEWNDEVAADLSLMKQNSGRLLDLVKQLLDFKKIDDGGYNLCMGETDVSALVSGVVDSFRPMLSNIEVGVDVPDECVAVIDGEALTKILSNLLGNAIKFTSSRIDVTLSRDEKYVMLSVSDDGSGLKEEDAEKIFNPFYQAGNSGNTGFGIGLSLVKRLCECHGGDISVRTSPGNGSVFTARILAGTESGQETPETEEPTSGINVLVVEDSDQIRQFLSGTLGASYNVLGASNGQEALRLLSSTSVDIIISDLMMPVMDGFELLKHIREDEMLCHIPFIILSAMSSLSDKMQGLEYGADAYIEKPFTVAQVKATIKNITQRRESLYKYFSSSPQIHYSSNDLAPRDAAWLEKLDSTIRENLSNSDFSIDKLASEIGGSRSYLQRKLKALTGTSPNDYVKLIRLREAAALLKEGSYRISEVCYLVGFSSPSYFTSCFTKQFGIQPKEYAAKSAAALQAKSED